MKGCVGILFYNDVDGLRRLIPSLLKSGVSYYDIQAFDGPFKQFPHNGMELSTDGSREYLQEIGIRIFDCGIGSHVEKTNIRFKMADKYGYDFMFAIDCDEYMMGNWPDMTKHLELCQERMSYFTYAVPFMDLDGTAYVKYDILSWHSSKCLVISGQLPIIYSSQSIANIKSYPYLSAILNLILVFST